MTAPTPARRALRLAHRGDHRHAPENSLAAIEAAVAVVGCDGVEFDLHAAADGTPVLSHDPTLERTHGRPDRVRDLAVGALESLGIPTLVDVLAAIPTDRVLDVELKEDVVAATVPLLRPWLEQGGRAVLSSFHAGVLRVARDVAPDVERWLNAESLDEDILATARELGCTTVSALWRRIDEAGLARARGAGLDVAAWTVRDRALLARLDAAGVTAACVEDEALEA